MASRNGPLDTPEPGVEEPNSESTLRSEIVEITRVASSARNAHEVCAALTATIRRFIAIDRLTIRAVDRPINTVTDIFVWGSEVEGWQQGATHDLSGTATAEVIRTGKPIIVDDVRSKAHSPDHEALRQSADELPALLAVPLVSGGRIFGTLQLRAEHVGHFTQQDLDTTVAIAAAAAPAVENAILVDSQRDEANERQALLDLGNVIVSSLNVESVFQRFAHLVSRIIPADRVAVNTLNPDGATYTERYTDGIAVKERAPGDVVDLEGTITKAVVERGAPITIDVCDEAKQQEVLKDFPGLAPAVDVGLCSFLSAPMVSEGKNIGSVHVRSSQPFAYKPKHIELIQQVASFTASAIAKSDLLLQLERESRERTVLAEIGRITASSLDFGDVFELVAEQVNKLVPAERVVVTTVDEEAGTITDKYVSGTELPGWDLNSEGRSIVGNPTEPVVKERRAIIVFNEEVDPVTPEGLRVSREVGLLSAMYAPLISDDRLIGTLNVKTTAPHAYSQSDLDALRRAAIQIAGAVAASDLHHEALRLAEAESENRELQKVNQAKSEFLSTVSHELKTPLTSMMAFANILKKNRNGNLSEREIGQIEVIERNGHNLTSLITDLVDVSRVDAGNLKLNPSQFDLKEVLKQVAESVQPLAASKGQQLSVDVPDGDVQIVADAERISQVVLNLVSNAVKYSPEDTEVRMVLTQDGAEVELSVIDEGIGISPTDMSQLFTAFFRADNPETRAQSGTGLGLVIARSIAELHGGQVTVHSKLGAGSTFTLNLPVELSSDAAA